MTFTRICQYGNTDWYIYGGSLRTWCELLYPVVAPPPPPHANACTGHNFVTDTPIKFIFAIAMDSRRSQITRTLWFLASIGKTKWPLAAILYKNAQKACGVYNCVTNSPINFIFGIAIDSTYRKWFSVIQNGRWQPFWGEKIKVVYWSEMARNVIEMWFLVIQNGPNRTSSSHLVKKKVVYWSEMARIASESDFC